MRFICEYDSGWSSMYRTRCYDLWELERELLTAFNMGYVLIRCYQESTSGERVELGYVPNYADSARSANA